MSTTTYLAEGTLSHGLRVAVRPMERGDRLDLIEGFEHLSSETKYRRFMSSKPRLSNADIKHLLDTDELAMVLVWPRSSCKDIVLGVAHAIRIPDQPGTAEFCIVLADEIHGRGAGRLLTNTLAAQATRDGITHLSAYMLATNKAPARLLAGVGTIESDVIESGTRDMTVRLK